MRFSPPRTTETLRHRGQIRNESLGASLVRGSTLTRPRTLKRALYKGGGNRRWLAECARSAQASACAKRAVRARPTRLQFLPAVSSTPDRPDAGDLVPLVYNELRRLAAAYMRRERPGQTLQATALVHEAYLRLAGAGRPWTDRKHFLAIAARSMRQILVEHARARGAQKRWAGLDRVSLTESLIRGVHEDAMLPALDDALARLEQIDPEQARIVELRYFAGLAIEEAAEALGLSPATVKRRWALARAWLFRELSDHR